MTDESSVHIKCLIPCIWAVLSSICLSCGIRKYVFCMSHVPRVSVNRCIAVWRTGNVWFLDCSEKRRKYWMLIAFLLLYIKKINQICRFILLCIKEKVRKKTVLICLTSVYWDDGICVRWLTDFSGNFLFKINWLYAASFHFIQNVCQFEIQSH